MTNITMSDDGRRLIAVFSELVAPLGAALAASSEVVLHDLSLLPNSIVAIHGNVTGRQIGDPATDLLLKKVSDLSADRMTGYETSLPDGRRIRSSTMLIRDIEGTPVAALCINSDLSAWVEVQRVAELMLAGYGAPVTAPLALAPDPNSEPAEVFVKDVDELAAYLIHRAIAKVGVPVDLMQKRHKVEVVRDLKKRGMFMLRDAIDMIAAALDVTRFTIYNYLNELGDEDARGDADTTLPDSNAKEQ